MSIAFGRLAQVNPSVPEMDALGDDDMVAFLPLEACWADGRADLTRRAAKATVANGYTRFLRGDVLVPKITPTFQAGRVLVADIETEVGAGTTELHVVRAGDASDARFLSYVLRSQPFLQEGATTLQGVGNLRRVPARFIEEFSVALGAHEAQGAIADYLDSETAQIDALIAKQERLIATLRERRSAEIARRALGGFAPLDRSQVSRPIGASFSVVLGKMLDAGKARDEGAHNLPYLRAANVRDAGLETSNAFSMPFTESEASRLDLRRGDLLVVEGGATVGKTARVVEDLDGWSFQKTLNRLRPLHGDSAWWLGYVLDAYRAGGAIAQITDGSTFAHLTAEKLRALRVPVVHLDEQHRIVAELDAQTAQIDELIGKAERFIALAKERRAALITAAVTGQIAVPGFDPAAGPADETTKVA